MTNLALAVLLFGSLARGESSRGSDVDVLFIHDGGEVKHVTAGKISMFHYPWASLKGLASSGDLFACHIAYEAKPILDEQDYLTQLRSAFRFKCTYREEAGNAADLAWFLVRYGQDLDTKLVPQRMIWCVRTILIARSPSSVARSSPPKSSPTSPARRPRARSFRDGTTEMRTR